MTNNVRGIVAKEFAYPAALGGGVAFTRVIDSIANLRLADKTKNSRIQVTGYYVAGDGGGGTYWYDSTDIVSADNSGTIIVGADGGRWKLIHAGQVTARQFGAKLDGTTNDTVFVQAALNAVGNVVINYSSAGCVLSGLEMNRGMSLSGQHGVLTGAENPNLGGQKTTIKLESGASFGIHVNSFTIGTYVKISTLRFDGAASTGTAIRFATASGIVFGVRFKDLSFMNCVEAIGDEVHATNYITDIEMDDINCFLTRGRQLYTKRSAGFILCSGVKIDHTQNSGTVTWEGARFDQVAGIEFDRFDVIGFGTGTTYQAGAVGLSVSGSGSYAASVWLNRVLCDTLHGPGINVTGIYNVQANFISAGLCWGPGITFSTCTYLDLSNVFVYGANLNASAPSSSAGVTFISCANGSVSGLNVKDCKGVGVIRQDTTHLKISNANIFANSTFGVLDVGTCNYNLINGASVVNNPSGSLTQLGAASAAVNWVATTGTFIPSTIGPATIA